MMIFSIRNIIGLQLQKAIHLGNLGLVQNEFQKDYKPLTEINVLALVKKISEENIKKS